MKKIIFALLLLVLVAMAPRWLKAKHPGKVSGMSTVSTVHKRVDAISAQLQLKAKEARTFVLKNSFNTQFCFLIDMSLPSGHNRFFVYDLKRDSIWQSGLVTHGNCNQQWLEGRKFGNDVGCGCTSLGKYRVGLSYMGRFGLAFKLYGLEGTNANAFARYVVLHSHSCVPASETADDICQSNGCPTVSPTFLHYLEPLIKSSRKPVLLWIW